MGNGGCPPTGSDSPFEMLMFSDLEKGHNFALRDSYYNISAM